MINRYDIKKIIDENPDYAHDIIADKLNVELVWGILIILGLTIGTLFVTVLSIIFNDGIVIK